MENKCPSVSYIIPCFNQARFLYEAISSVMLSYSGPKEIFVINDSSTEPLTQKIFNEINLTFPSVKIIHHEINKGLSATRNTGISLSTGDYIQFLDADDMLFPGKVDFQIEHFRLGNNIDVSITDYFYGNESLSEFTIPEPCIGSFKLSLEEFLNKWERGLSIPIHCGLFKKDLVTEIRFEESITAKEDWVFWSKLAHLRKRLSFLNITGAVYRLHTAAMTKSKQEEMGRMWIKASTIINDLLQKNDNLFINNSLSWYEAIYKKEIGKSDDINVIPVDKPVSDNSSLKADHEAVQRLVVKPNSGQKKIITVVVPIFNHYEYLSECIGSVISQSFLDYELICIDDNSSDSRVKKYLQDLEAYLPNIKVIYNSQNMGISASFNQGIGIAEGDYIAFLDCDDYLASNALVEVNKQIIKNPETDYFFSDKVDIDENGKIIREAVYGGYQQIRPTNDFEGDLLDGMVASHLKVIRREKLKEVGSFNSSLDGVQDYDLALRILENGKFKYIHKLLYYHRQHTSSITQSQTVSQFRKMNIARRNYCERVYNKKNHSDEGINYYKDCITSGIDYSKVELDQYGIVLLNARTMTLKEIKENVKRGYTCIVDARVDYESNLKYFIREYNSYFDLIVTDSGQLAISILGVLWDYKVLWMQSLQ